MTWKPLNLARKDGYTRENPATWSGRYHDIQWLAVSGVRGGESDA